MFEIYVSGFVTTTRITHATPAALYGHTYDRFFESDANYRGQAFGIFIREIELCLDDFEFQVRVPQREFTTSLGNSSMNHRLKI